MVWDTHNASHDCISVNMHLGGLYAVNTRAILKHKTQGLLNKLIGRNGFHAAWLILYIGAMGGRGGLGKSQTLFSRSGWPSSGDGHSTLYVEGVLCVVLSLTRSLKETRGGGSEKAQPGGFPFGSLRLAPLQSCGGLLLDVVNVPRTSKRGRNRAWGMVREPGGRRRSHLCRGAVDGWMGECGPAGRAPSPSTPGHAPWLPSVPSGPSGCWTSHTGLWRQEPRNNTVHTAHLEAL